MRLTFVAVVFSGVVLGVGSFGAAAQPYVPGEAYFGANNYIEYVAGNMPLILTATHGGQLTPADIPDRSCADCVTVTDANTQDLSRRIQQAIYNRIGCYPHLVINRLHRRKLDANRDLPEAADGDPIAGQAWQEFHAFIDSARAAAGRALLIDLHGHGHPIQRLEWGYLLFGSELREPDPELNTPTFVDFSSIRQLVADNLGGRNHAQLLRGAGSLGQLLAERGYPGVPSADDPAPQPGDPYFSGGYITDRHGSRLGGVTDAIQLECNFLDVRDTPANRQAFADSLAVALEVYLRLHYLPNPGACLPVGAAEADGAGEGLQVFPNPGAGPLTVRWAGGATRLDWYDLTGRRLGSYPLQPDQTELELELEGTVLLVLSAHGRVLGRRMALVR